MPTMESQQELVVSVVKGMEEKGSNGVPVSGKPKEETTSVLVNKSMVLRIHQVNLRRQ